MADADKLKEDYGRVSTFWREGGLNRKLNVGLVGGATEDSFFVRNAWVPTIRALQRQLNIIGIQDIDTKAADQFAKDFGVKSYPTLDDLAGDKDVDIALIGTPTAYHADIAKKLIEAGKTIICEKPMTHTADSALELVKMVYDGSNNGYGHRFAVSYTQSHAPMAVLAKYMSLIPFVDQEVREKDLDEIQSFAIQYLQAWMSVHRKPGEPGYRQEMARTKTEQTGSSNVNADINTHGYDFLEMVAQGNEIAKIDAKLTSNTGRDKDDSAIVWVELTNGATGTLTANNAWHAKLNELKADVAYKQGSLYFESENSDVLGVQLPGLPRLQYSNGAQDTIITNSGRVPMPGIIGAMSFMPAGHEGAAYHYKLENLALAVAEATACDLMGIDPQCLQRPYRTVIPGLKGAQFVEMCVDNNDKGVVENPFAKINAKLPADKQAIAVPYIAPKPA